MKLFLSKRGKSINATVEYLPENKIFIVKKGSIVSDSVATNTKFRSARSIERLRDGTVIDQVVQEDVVFNSASMAANFITGASTNGLIALKDEQGRTLKDIIAES